MKRKIVDSTPLATFCALPNDPEVDKHIASKEKEIQACLAADAIKTRAAFRTLQAPPLDVAKLRALLATTLVTISASAREKVEAHIARLGSGSREWIRSGRGFQTQNECPFCGLALSGSDLVEHYDAYFNEEYDKLKQRMSEATKYLDERFGGEARARFESAVASEQAAKEFWDVHLSLPRQSLDATRILASWSKAVASIRTLLQRKLGTPLEPVALDDSALALIEEYAREAETLKSATEVLVAKNTEIEGLKATVSAASLQVLQRDLATLKNLKARQEPATSALCDTFIKHSTELTKRQSEKATAKTALEAHSRNVFKKYRAAINRMLRDFGVGFEIGEMKETFDGGKSGSSFTLIIEGRSVDLEAGRSDEPCFGNTLSAGDRAALALAFFVAQFEASADPKDAVLVFDDPISSLDANRRLQTRQEIVALKKKAKQVIVLSHQESFLIDVWDAVHGVPDRNSLRVDRGRKGSQLATWDIDRARETELERSRAILTKYRDEGPTSVRTAEAAPTIRLFLEGFLRVVDPDRLGPGEWLGGYLGAVRKALDAGVERFLSEERYDALAALNDYSKPFHHNTNPSGTPTTINEAELDTRVRLALEWAFPHHR